MPRTDFLTDRPNMRKHLTLILLGFAVGVLFYAFHNFKEQLNPWEIALNGVLGIAISYVFHWSNQFLNKVVNWRAQTGIRLLLGIIVHLFSGMTLVFFTLKTYQFIYPKYDFFSGSGRMVFLKMGVVMFFIVLLYNIIYFTFFSYQQYVKGQILESRIKRRQTELQLRALKSQLSPHFLFNCLNVLSSLVIKDTNAAENFIRSLAKSYDYTIKTYQNTLVNVAEELEFVTSYYYLMKTRFQQHIVLDINISDSSKQSKIPPLTLQMLVENAIKHNIADADRILKIEIRDEGGHMEVSNNISNARKGTKSTKVGLQNIASRYELLVNGKIIVDSSQSIFSVKLPLLK